MCYHRSMIVTEDLKVFVHPTCDHHTQIRALHHIREEGFHHTVPHAAIECNPVTDLFNIETWNKVLDEKVKPLWWTKKHWDVIMNKLTSEFKLRASVDSSVYKTTGDLALPYLKIFKPKTVLISEATMLIAPRELINVTIITNTLRFDVRDLAAHNCRNNTIMCRKLECEHSGIEKYLFQTGQLVIRDEEQKRFFDRRRDRFDSTALADICYPAKCPVDFVFQ